MYFRNTHEESKLVGEKELKYILETRQKDEKVKKGNLTFLQTLKSKNMLLAM